MGEHVGYGTGSGKVQTVGILHYLGQVHGHYLSSLEKDRGHTHL